MMKIKLSAAILVAFAIVNARAETMSSKTFDIEEEYSQRMREERLSSTYSSNLKMRDSRKVGAGISVGGALGAIGANLEFNFEDADGAFAGFGTGPGYNSVALAWKHSFEGDYISPYTSVGYSRWYNSHGGEGYRDSSILDRVLTSAEKKSGQFGTDFLTGSIGLQYNQLSGELAGVSAYAELVGLIEVKRSQFLPSGTVGALYYF